ncbi:MAG TPA: IS630 family transposase [Pyrinomonadaceae bacterium]
MRGVYRRTTRSLDLSRFKFVDEAGVNLALTRLFGRAPRGERVVDTVPQNYGENVTMLGALSLSGVEALMTVNGATDGDIFLVFVREVLAPTLSEGDLVIWDNLGAHRSQAVREVVEQRGAHLLFLPPYSPDMNPIERCWSKIKTFLRAAKARTREALETAIKQALATVTESDARAWFEHCGYAVN